MTVELVFGDGTDKLTFKRDTRASHHETWAAEVEKLRESFSPYRYLVYKWKNHWATTRPKHPVLDDFDRVYTKREDAMQACAEDFAVIARLRRWQDYMKTHEPPYEPADV